MRRLLLPVLSLVTVVGCATTPLLQFTSVSPPLRQSPVAVGLEPSRDSIRIEAQFDRIEGDEILFGLEIWNLTGAPLDVDPATFEYGVVLPDSQEVPGVGAVDPEWKLAVHDQRTNMVRSLAPREPEDVSGWQLLGDLLDLLTSGSRTEQEERDRELLRLKQAEEAREARAEHQRRLDRRRLERETLVRERMRRSRLPLGQSMTGRVAFPVAPLLSALNKGQAYGRGITRVDSPPDSASAGLVLRCRIGDHIRERRFRIRRY